MKNIWILVALIYLCASAAAVFAAPGDLDPSFDGDGFLINRFGEGYSRGNASALQPDGKIVVVGFSYGDPNYQIFSMARFNPDGSLDTSFGAGGKVETDFAGGEVDNAMAVEIAADGKIVVAGWTQSLGTQQIDIAVARYNSDGTLDTAFSGDGKLTLRPNNAVRSEAASIGLLADGSIYLAGFISIPGNGAAGDTLLIKLDSAGNYAAGFGTGGIFKVDAGDSNAGDGASDIVIAESENVIFLAGGAASNEGTASLTNRAIVIKLNLNGVIDTNFDSNIFPPKNGIGHYPFLPGAASIDYEPGAAVPLVIGGTYFDINATPKYGVVKILASGELQSAVNTSIPTTTGSFCRAVKFQPDGKILAGGYSQFTLNNFTLVRYNPDLTLDTSFSGDGLARVEISPGSNDFGRSLMLQSDGRVILTGESNSINFALARLTPTGGIDGSFGTNGRQTARTGSGASIIAASARQPDGKILVAGSVNAVTSEKSFYVARHNLDGSLDTTFSGDGIATMTFSGSDVTINDMTLQPDGKIVVAGDCGLYTICGARFLPNGDPDPAIATCCAPTGAWSYFINSNFRISAKTVDVTPDGKILLAGSRRLASGPNSFFDTTLLVRFDSNGTLDGTFPEQFYNLGGAASEFRDMRVLSNGKIVLTSDGVEDTNTDFTIVRLNADGSFDNSFDFDGKAYIDFGATDSPTALDVLADGKILVAGTATVSGRTVFASARLNTDGSPDTMLDGDGRVTTAIGTNSSVPLAVRGQSDGKFILAGYTINPEKQSALVRYNANGSLDNNIWGANGIVVSDFGAASEFRTLFIQPNGSVFAAGKAGGNMLLARYFGALVPTASNVSVSGRVLGAGGRGLFNASVYLTDAAGTTRWARTTSFGNYRFEGVLAGQTVIVGVVSKLYQFEPRVLSLSENVADCDFTPLSSQKRE